MTIPMVVSALAGWVLIAVAAPRSASRPFQLPTANRALIDMGGGERYFVGTVGRSWESGTFGCVRSSGAQFHEGLDIRCLQRDDQGEPVDSVFATADGTVAYYSRNPALSTYGRYVILLHHVEGVEIYSLYAHLREIRSDLKPGQQVKAGEALGTMGRSANTRDGISKERAHLHFELALIVNERFSAWYKTTLPTQRNDHGGWNGQNFLGLDPHVLLLAEPNTGNRFSLLQHLYGQNELCRVQVRVKDFPWIRRYWALVRPNPKAEREGLAGYEMALNFNGVPFEIIPRAASELRGTSKYALLSVNEAEHQRHPCGKFLTKRNSRWDLASRGTRLLDLLTY